MPLIDADSVEKPPELLRPPSAKGWEKWFKCLNECRVLTDGWNGYTAPAPNAQSIENAQRFLEAMQSAGCEPTRVSPSAMGGVAITRKTGDKKVFVEFYNDLRVYALFSDRASNEMHVEPLGTDLPSIQQFLAKSREYLHG